MKASFNRREKGEGFPRQRLVVLPPSIVALMQDERLTHGFFPTDIGFFPNARGHLRERKQGIDQAIFIHCSGGSGWCDLDGRVHDIKTGDLLIIPPCTPHSYGADDTHPWSICWFHAQGELVRNFLQELQVSVDRPVIHCGKNPQLNVLFEEALSALEHDYARLQLITAAQTLAHLVVAYVRAHRNETQSHPDVQQKIRQTVVFMRQHLGQPIQLDTLAAMSGLSRSRYAELFKRQTGYAPIDYCIRLKIQRACQLLDTTHLSVKEIAAMLGYEDPLYFSKLFRKVNEISPLQYRHLNKG